MRKIISLLLVFVLVFTTTGTTNVLAEDSKIIQNTGSKSITITLTELGEKAAGNQVIAIIDGVEVLKSDVHKDGTLKISKYNNIMDAIDANELQDKTSIQYGDISTNVVINPGGGSYKSCEVLRSTSSYGFNQVVLDCYYSVGRGRDYARKLDDIVRGSSVASLFTGLFSFIAPVGGLSLAIVSILSSASAFRLSDVAGDVRAQTDYNHKVKITHINSNYADSIICKGYWDGYSIDLTLYNAIGTTSSLIGTSWYVD